MATAAQSADEANDLVGLLPRPVKGGSTAQAILAYRVAATKSN
jgi:hypothetical protein